MAEQVPDSSRLCSSGIQCFSLRVEFNGNPPWKVRESSMYNTELKTAEDKGVGPESTMAGKMAREAAPLRQCLPVLLPSDWICEIDAVGVFASPCVPCLDNSLKFSKNPYGRLEDQVNMVVDEQVLPTWIHVSLIPQIE